MFEKTPHASAGQPPAKSDRPMTVAEFNAKKKAILSLLRAKGDDLPQANVAHGQFSRSETPIRLKNILGARENTLTLVRGYRLVVAHLGDGDDSLAVCAAQGALALRGADGKLQSVTRGDNFQDIPFIFVPSSRMYPSLSDDDLVSGKYRFCTILFDEYGAAQMLQRVRLNMSSLEKQKFALSPEEAEPLPAALVRDFPFFQEYFEGAKHAFESPCDTAMCFGMPWRPITNADIERLDLAGGTRMVEFEYVDSGEFVSPSTPWRFDRDAWLPSVPTLHRLLEDMFAAESQIPQMLHRFFMFEILEKLGREYQQRLYQAHERCSHEIDVRCVGGFV